MIRNASGQPFALPLSQLPAVPYASTVAELLFNLRSARDPFTAQAMMRRYVEGRNSSRARSHRHLDLVEVERVFPEFAHEADVTRMIYNLGPYEIAGHSKPRRRTEKMDPHCPCVQCRPVADDDAPPPVPPKDDVPKQYQEVGERTRSPSPAGCSLDSVVPAPPSSVASSSLGSSRTRVWRNGRLVRGPSELDMYVNGSLAGDSAPNWSPRSTSSWSGSSAITEPDQDDQPPPYTLT